MSSIADDFNIIHEHPLYIDNKSTYQSYYDFYAGGSNVEDTTDYLPQHPYESDAQYKVRLQLATYRNLAKPIVSVFSSSILRRDPVRDGLPSEIERYLEDVDGVGSTVDVFFGSMIRQIAAMGVYFVLVDASKPSGIQPGEQVVLTKRDSEVLGIRPRLIPISPLNCIAWGHDDNDQLEYVVMTEAKIEDTGPWDGYEELTQYKIWYRDRWELWRYDEKNGFQKYDEGTHPCGVVPVVPGYFNKRFEMVGASCFDEVMSLLKRAYILENTLDKSLFDTAFPQQGFYGFQKHEIEDYIRASSNGLVASDPSAKSEFIEPSGRAFEAIQNKIKDDEKAIREISLRMVRPDSKQVESADSKKIDREQLNSQLAIFSRNAEDFELNCWWVFGKWLGIDDASLDNIEITYNRDFDIEKISSDLLKAFSDMRRNGDLSRETYWEMLKSGEIPLPDDFDPVEEAAKIENDQRSSTSMGALGRSFLTGTPTV